MRLDPIERPKQLIAKIAYWMTKRRLGKVMTPMKVVYARVPRLFRLAYEEVKVLDSGLLLEPATRFLVQTWVATINGCAFCVDIAKAAAIQQHMTLEKF